MKSTSIILIILITNILCSGLFHLKKDKSYSIKTDNKGLVFFDLPIEKNNKGEFKDVKINSKLIKNDNQIKPILIASKEKLPNINKKNQLLCEDFGIKECIIPSKFISESKNQKVNIGVYCKNCDFTLSVNFIPIEINSKQRKLTTNLLQTNPKSLYATSEVPQEKDQLDYFRADGISALIIGLIIVFVGYVAAHTMMNIYVHTSKLVEEPLKLGRIDA